MSHVIWGTAVPLLYTVILGVLGHLRIKVNKVVAHIAQLVFVHLTENQNKILEKDLSTYS